MQCILILCEYLALVLVINFVFCYVHTRQSNCHDPLVWLHSAASPNLIDTSTIRLTRGDVLAPRQISRAGFFCASRCVTASHDEWPPSLLAPIPTKVARNRALWDRGQEPPLSASSVKTDPGCKGFRRGPRHATDPSRRGSGRRGGALEAQVSLTDAFTHRL